MSDLVERLIHAVRESERKLANNANQLHVDKLAADLRLELERIAELEADNARLRVDGDRYHHIRKHTIGERVNMGQWFSFPFIKPVGNIMQGSVAQHLDDAIDAARKEQS